ncbi:hypothetical protein E3P98_02621 [Wallemia ichthyophaga]|uniref:Histone-lysine N-methyltransferase, H3 lysine-79 specific n=1 Tax=Wallemia ichthyophaga TaxID=245174 RepID=A0A4T0JJ48_WALIC|nr:hypothetical protein E3P98_02621 [Wallemia ichthyophaga]TIB43240.1 hypothetical protein E3P86_00024 [Wallemia ichthyophaga]
MNSFWNKKNSFNKKPASVSVKTETRKFRAPATSNPPTKKQKTAGDSLERGSSNSLEGSSSNSTSSTTRSTWLRDNHTPITRNPITASKESNTFDKATKSSRQLVNEQAMQYTSYFDDLNGSGSDPFPTIQLQLPAGIEEYALAVPKNRDNYSPIHDLVDTIKILIAWFIPPQSRGLFGNTETYHSSTQSSTSSETSTSILRLLQRSFNRRQGKLFIDAIDQFNREFQQLVQTDQITKHLESLQGIHPQVWTHITTQSYQRIVGPRVADLRHYEPFSSNIYGEIMPPFVAHLAHRMHIGPQTLVVDLGAGVGNVVLQLSLAAGCKSFGVEVMDKPADLAQVQLSEGRARSAMYSLDCGEMYLEKEDFCHSSTLSRKLPDADVVLINNYAFSAQLNEQLSLLFLDLKDGAKIVSLKPFLPANFRISDATVNSPLAILQMQKGDYFPGSVSWTDKGDHYYIHTVDRTALNRYLQGK